MYFFCGVQNIRTKEIWRKESCKNSANKYGISDETLRNKYVDQYPMKHKIYYRKHNNNNNNNNNNDNNKNNNILISVL